MRFSKFLVGLLSIVICLGVLAGIIVSYLVPEIPDTELGTVFSILIVLAIFVPMAYLPRFLKKQASNTDISFPMFMFIALSIVTLAIQNDFKPTIDTSTTPIRYPVDLLDFTTTLLQSPTIIIAVHFGRAAAWLFVGLRLKRVAILDKSIRPFRVLMILGALASGSIMAAPLVRVIVPLAYGALGAFLISTKLGVTERPRLQILDDYIPA